VSATFDSGEPPHACAQCLRRGWLLASVSALLDRFALDRERFDALLALGDEQLIDAIGGGRRDALRAAYRVARPGAEAEQSGAGAICVHDARYPVASGERDAARVLYVAGGATRLQALTDAPVVALLGNCGASDYGREVARGLARSLAACGVTVVSVLNGGVGEAAQTGALDAGCGALALVGDGLHVALGGARGALHPRITQAGCVISELPAEAHGRRWGWLSCERIAVALASLAIVVEAEDSDADLAAARLARERGTALAAVPGRVTSRLSRGAHALLRDGASLVSCAQDALELLCAPGEANAQAHAAARPCAALEPDLSAVFESVGTGADTPDASVSACGRPLFSVLLALSDLELRGLLRRGRGGRYVRSA